MATGQPFDEGYDNAVRAVMRPTQPPPSGKLRVADLFCGTGSLGQVAQEAGMKIVYAHDPGGKQRTRTAYTKKFGLEPHDSQLPNFTETPPFDIVLAELPKGGIEEALSFVLRFLRVRRPDTFVLVGSVGENEDALVTYVREKTQSLGYQVASSADMLLGIYEPKAEKDLPVIVGLYLLDPIRIPVLTSDEPGRGRSASMIKTVLERIVEAFTPPSSQRPT